jgi:hypothetical protein
MTKAIGIFGVFFFSILSASYGQLAHTKWKGTLLMDQNVDVIWIFDKDTTLIFAKADSSLIEKMVYTVDKGYLLVNRIEGASGCDNKITGKYKFEIKDDKLYLTLFSDACSDRTDAISSDAYIRVKE